jgi:hypothetical protein
MFAELVAGWPSIYMLAFDDLSYHAKPDPKKRSPRNTPGDLTTKRQIRPPPQQIRSDRSQDQEGYIE